MSDRAFRYIEKRSSSHYTNESKPEQCLVLFSDSLSGLLFMRVVNTASLPPHSLLRTPSHDHQVLRNFRHFLFQNHMSHIQSNPTCPHPHGHRIPIVLCCGVLYHQSDNQGPLFCLYFPKQDHLENVCLHVFECGHVQKQLPGQNPNLFNATSHKGDGE